MFLILLQPYKFELYRRSYFSKERLLFFSYISFSLIDKYDDSWDVYPVHRGSSQIIHKGYEYRARNDIRSASITKSACKLKQCWGCFNIYVFKLEYFHIFGNFTVSVQERKVLSDTAILTIKYFGVYVYFSIFFLKYIYVILKVRKNSNKSVLIWNTFLLRTAFQF